MASPTATPRVPSYRCHKPTGQAVVTLSGRDIYLGLWKTKASRAEYDRLIGEWLANGRQTPSASSDLTVAELAARYWTFAQGHYGRNRRRSGHVENIRTALRWLRQCYGPSQAAEFGPRALKAMRERMVQADVSRPYVNKLVDLIRRVFRWAVGEELLPASAHQALQAVPGLRRGFTEARETSPVLPVDDATVEATLAKLGPVVADMVRFQRLTGSRPAEVCILRPCDVDTSGDVWTYRPSSHKTQHHGRERVILLGPKAQDVLRPYLLRDKQAFCFSPTDSQRQRWAELRERRRTKVQPSQVCRKKRNPSRMAGEQYTTCSYRRAIERACDLAFPAPEGLSTAERQAWRKAHHWAPNRLRHAAATEIRRRFGLEAAQVTLGHASADVSQIYAERDLTLAAQVMREVG